MKFHKTSLIALITACFLLGGCNKGGNESTVENNDTTPPTIDGVPFEAEISAGESYNALKGVSAIDDVDGDITDQIVVEVLPYTEVVNGVFTPAIPGTYEVGYSVKDKAGNEANEFTELTVKAGYKDKEVVKTIDFSYIDEDVNILLSEENGSYLLKTDGYYLDIDKGGAAKEDISFSANFTPKEGCEYTVSFLLHSNKAGNVYFGEEEIALTSGNNEVTATKKYSVDDLEDGKTALTFTLYLGELDDGTKLEIHRLEALEKSDEIGYDDLIENFDFSTQNAVEFRFNDGSQGTSEATASKATMNITQRASGNGVWQTQLVVDTGVALTTGTYIYSLKAKSTYGYENFEIVYYNGNIEKGYRNANGGDALYGQKLSADTEKEFTDTLVVENDGNNLRLVFQIGHLDNGLDANDFTVSELTLKKQKGEVNIRKTFTYAFNDVYESHSESGQGSTYVKDDNFVYDMTSIGTVDWHNKVVIGLGELAMLNRYSAGIKMSASKDITFMAFINQRGGSWAPIASASLTATSEMQELIIAMDEALNPAYDGNEYELLLQFGSEVNANLGGVTLSFNQVNVYAEEYIQ